MRNSSIRVGVSSASVVMFRRIGIICVALSPLVSAWSAQAQSSQDEPAIPPPRLKSAPTLEPPSLKPPQAVAAPGERDAIFLRADRLEGEGQSWVEAEGKVELRTRRQTLLADWLRYDIPNDEFWGKGNVTLRRGIDWITGPEARFKRDDETGFFTSPEFHVGENGSRGDATQLTFVGPDRYDVKDARYTTCTIGDDDWYLTAGDVDLDRSRLVGTAHDATVVFKGVPILYSPYLSFPLSNDRKSGFLTPIYGSSNQRGFEMAIPYYLNLAPNYDATLLARPMSRRGIQLAGQFRYLFPESSGELDAEYLPHDRQTDTDRYAVFWKHNQTFGAGFAGYVNVEKVSDDTYFADLSDRLALTSQTNLPREAGIVYDHAPFSVLARVQAFQTLQDPDNPITPPYFREPQVLLTMQPVEWQGLDLAGTGEFVHFRQPALTPNGDRTYIYPTVTWSQRGSAWFFTAQTGLHLTHYDLENPVTPPASFDRAVPITTVDGGLFFERETEWLGRSFIQTLEPRAFYVSIPYRNQSNYPNFDTAVGDFNFSQLFTANRYLGIDRIGDANQLTLAVTSRFLDPATGEEKMRFAIGQQYYFESQQVTLNEPPRTTNSSDILLSAEARLSDVWTAATLWDFQPSNKLTEIFNFGVRWQPGAGRVLNFTYRFNRQDTDASGNSSQLKQIDLSGQWPLSANWSAIGRWNYSLVDAKTLEGVVGLEYNGGCWVFRVAAQRLQTNTQTVSNSVYVQFELNGLARIGTNPIDVLRRSVPGYQKVNDPTLQPIGNAPSDYFPGF
jgi:LPS-assembly protein